MQFNKVIGQEAIKKRLIEGVKENRVSHAQLFSGPEGVGKLAMAIAYAQYINCPNKTANDACGTCNSCRKYEKLIHPDLHFVYPVVKTKGIKDPVSDHFIAEWRQQVSKNPYFNLTGWFNALNVENAQGQIYVHESAEIIKKLNLKTFEADYKVMIVWIAERMNVQCANKLLKMIEEPPPKTVFILISENEEQILTTIRSRTQLVKFSSVDNQSLLQAINEHPNSEGKSIDGILHLANGNYISALELLEHDEDKKYFFEKFTEIMRVSYKRDWMAMFSWVEEVSGIGREKQKSLIRYSTRMLRENFVKNFNDSELVYLTDEENGFSERFSPFINERNILIFSDEFEKAFRDISQNGNARIIFLDLALKVVKMIRA